MQKVIELLYWCGVDFCINMANLLGITYDEFNLFLFFILMPAVAILLLLLNVWKGYKIYYTKGS
jgi:hypothetical protein